MCVLILVFTCLYMQLWIFMATVAHLYSVGFTSHVNSIIAFDWLRNTWIKLLLFLFYYLCNIYDGVLLLPQHMHNFCWNSLEKRGENIFKRTAAGVLEKFKINAVNSILSLPISVNSSYFFSWTMVTWYFYASTVGMLEDQTLQVSLLVALCWEA